MNEYYSNTITLNQVAEDWWINQGNVVPPKGTREYDVMYQNWWKFAFSHLTTD